MDWKASLESVGFSDVEIASPLTMVFVSIKKKDLKKVLVAAKINVEDYGLTENQIDEEFKFFRYNGWKDTALYLKNPENRENWNALVNALRHYIENIEEVIEFNGESVNAEFEKVIDELDGLFLAEKMKTEEEE